MLFKPLIYEPAKHLIRLMTEPEYLTWCIQDAKLGKCERFVPKKTMINGWSLFMPDAASFLATYKELFVNKIYKFNFSGGRPKILDLGANIGLSVLYFKSIFPNSEIDAYEADPAIFTYLSKNVYENGFSDVKIHNQAVWSSTCTLEFIQEGADGGGISHKDSADPRTILIDAIDVQDIVRNKKYDFLKMDIEGAEAEVLPRLEGMLTQFTYIFLEYHSTPGSAQSLSDLLNILRGSGFRVKIYNAVDQCLKPFIAPFNINHYDLQLNIFASKDSALV